MAYWKIQSRERSAIPLTNGNKWVIIATTFNYKKARANNIHVNANPGGHWIEHYGFFKTRREARLRAKQINNYWHFKAVRFEEAKNRYKAKEEGEWFDYTHSYLTRQHALNIANYIAKSDIVYEYRVMKDKH